MESSSPFPITNINEFYQWMYVHVHIENLTIPTTNKLTPDYIEAINKALSKYGYIIHYYPQDGHIYVQLLKLGG